MRQSAFCLSLAVALIQTLNRKTHRAYLRGMKEKGVLIASGPMDPRFGGLVLLRVEDDDLKTLDAVRDNDPFFQSGVAQYELIGWKPVMGKDELDRL